KEQFFYVCLVIAFILSVLFLFVWIETSNEYNSFDWVVYLGTGRWFFWSIFVLSAAGILAAYTTLLLLIGFLLLWERIELNLHKSHKVFIWITIILCSFLLCVLSYFWRDKWLIAGLSLQIFAPFVHLSLITVMIIISWPLAICVAHLESEVRIRRYRMADYEHEILERCNIFRRLRALQIAAGLSFLIILLCLYLMPLGIYSPCILKKEDLGPKPSLFGHRGAPMLAPENTMMSFEKAIEFDAFGLETDVYLSWDHVPFLMHDYDLTRTTNIKEVLPSAANNVTSNFYWTLLSTLNAGEWFLKVPVPGDKGKRKLTLNDSASEETSSEDGENEDDTSSQDGLDSDEQTELDEEAARYEKERYRPDPPYAPGSLPSAPQLLVRKTKQEQARRHVIPIATSLIPEKERRRIRAAFPVFEDQNQQRYHRSLDLKQLKSLAESEQENPIWVPTRLTRIVKDGEKENPDPEAVDVNVSDINSLDSHKEQPTSGAILAMECTMHQNA
ncbi:glycerophosphodiester phosphodiesterase domain-containing protein 4-like, partial [Arvicanthis niloticus]|uniref:glycerophosphodiester phosphodiesterase domain-containing protein 4-like n=1 Tax=Arvicanthis niloticus TaxID=61156 RepID=UPI0014870764